MCKYTYKDKYKYSGITGYFEPSGAIWSNLGASCRQVMKKLVSCVDVARSLLKILIFPCVFDVEVGFVR